MTVRAVARDCTFITFGISEKSGDIRRMLIEVLGRGMTVYKGARGYGKRGDGNTDQDIIFTVVTRLEPA